MILELELLPFPGWLPLTLHPEKALLIAQSRHPRDQFQSILQIKSLRMTKITTIDTKCRNWAFNAPISLSLQAELGTARASGFAYVKKEGAVTEAAHLPRVPASFTARTFQNGEWTGAAEDGLTQQGS